MRNWLGVLAALAILEGCGAGAKPASSTTATAQGAAKLWLQAAVDRDNARLAELSTDDFKAKAAGYGDQIREKFDSTKYIRWGGSGKEGADYAWTATGPGGVVFMKVREVSTNQYRVSDVQPSW